MPSATRAAGPETAATVVGETADTSMGPVPSPRLWRTAPMASEILRQLSYISGIREVRAAEPAARHGRGLDPLVDTSSGDGVVA
jgi:hypothetical protein